MDSSFVSILMLTHNAPDFVELSVRSLRERTAGVAYELIVLDNASEPPTRDLVTRLHQDGLIDRLRLLERNSLFAEGNNLAADMAGAQATHFLLLNSDIEAKDPAWLRHMLEIHRRGITALGVAPDFPARVDGYCLLIDADLYRQTRLDESHQWWWSVTKLQAQLLCQGHAVQGLREHEQYLHHFGKKSGSAFQNAKGMAVTREEVLSWFGGHQPRMLDSDGEEFLRSIAPRAPRPEARLKSAIGRMLGRGR